MDVLDRLHAAQAAFYAGEDVSAVRDVLTDDIVWHVPGSNAIAGDHRGIDAVLDYFTRRRDLANKTFRMHPRDILVGSGDTVAALTDVSGATTRGMVRRRRGVPGAIEAAAHACAARRRSSRGPPYHPQRRVQRCECALLSSLP